MVRGEQVRALAAGGQRQHLLATRVPVHEVCGEQRVGAKTVGVAVCSELRVAAASSLGSMQRYTIEQ